MLLIKGRASVERKKPVVGIIAFNQGWLTLIIFIKRPMIK
jgi:hypothetical protein